ncbi:hypothetical protein B0T24DRAFT_380944 [Lasiosphaeria ovina]|uniref:Rhodopsin domain-containing protein n=1 Tax=Lasiosphaeria ovina TaxID=92902 RepID=A0AAE0N1T6_9PEZI|nr:hypothetical protein B0T24DRAFT_380944 [Lasiosphaeria ovina]
MSGTTKAASDTPPILVFNLDAPFILEPAGPIPYSGFQVFGLFLLAFFPALSFAVCCLRAYSRRLAKGFGLDDWLIFLAMALAIPQAFFATITFRAQYWGIHDQDIPPHPFTQGLFWGYMDRVFYNPLLALVKASALIFLLRLGGTRHLIRLACVALMWFSILQAFAFFLVTVFSCDPVEFSWFGAASGRCINPARFSLSLASINIVTDILILYIPYCMFLNLKVNRRVRNSLLVVFMLGGLVTLVSAVRLYFVVKAFYLHPSQVHYSLGYTTTTIEVNLAIVTASVPALWPLGRRWFPGVFESLGINRPYLYPDIEVGYATDDKKRRSNNSSGSHSWDSTRVNNNNNNNNKKPSRPLRGKVSWRERRYVPSGVFAGSRPREEEGRDGNIDLFAHITDIRSQPVVLGRAHHEKNRSWYDENNGDDDLLDTYHGIIRKTDIVVVHEDHVGGAVAKPLDSSPRRGSGDDELARDSHGNNRL